MRQQLSEILGGIDKLTKRSDLDQVYEALNGRARELKARKTRKLQRMLSVGDVVRLATNMKPRYISEAEGPITKIQGTKVTIQMPDDPGLRRLSGIPCTVPFSAISARVHKASS